MPIITLEGPQLELEEKRSLVRDITTLAARTYRLPETSIIVLIRENQPDNVGVAGTLIADRSG